jgi:ribosomal protein S18 acetylase RimI-like enzyme
MELHLAALAIRQAVEGDRETIVELCVRAYADVRAQQPGEILDCIWEEWKANLPHTIDIKRVVVAEIDGEAVGFASYKLDDATRIGTVDDNAVLPHYRGRGVGRQMLARVLEIVEAAGMEFAQVSTGLEEPYAAARRMYERQGFTPYFRSVSYMKKLAQSAT